MAQKCVIYIHDHPVSSATAPFKAKAKKSAAVQLLKIIQEDPDFLGRHCICQRPEIEENSADEA